MFEHPLRGPGSTVEEIQNTQGVVRFAGDVKDWPPGVDEARPARCVKCRVGAREAGILRLHGHGVVPRQQRGPAAPGDAPTCQVIDLRRYRCIECQAVMCVVPASCVARKHFSGAAIAQALALWGLAGLSAGAVHQRINDWQVRGAASRGWRALQRWAQDVADGRLFRPLQGSAPTESLRTVAKRAAQVLCGYAPIPWRSAPVEHQAHVGSCHVS
jgi:hypothetical protein